MEDDGKLIVVSMRDVIRYPRMTPAEKAQAKTWTAIKLLIYWICDPERGDLYIGMTRRGLIRRIEKHLKEQTAIGKMIRMAPDIACTWNITLFPCESIEQAVKAERAFIASVRPIFNHQHNPDNNRREL